MREKDIHNLIEQQNPEVKQQTWEKIRAQIGDDDLQSKQTVIYHKQAATVKMSPLKWATVALAIVCVVTLSIVLPIVLRDDDGGGGGGLRYCTVEQYETDELGQTLGEYSASHNKGFLSVDWYDAADEITTYYGYNKEDKNDVFYISETITNGDTGETLTVSVTDNKTRVDIFDSYFHDYVEHIVDRITVNFRLNSFDITVAMFEYQNNIYYLELEEGDALDRLTEIIQDMLK